jgi:predicted GNAT family acetyltransferase
VPGRKVKGLLGPWVEAEAALDALDLRTQLRAPLSPEDLFSLSLGELKVPHELARGRLTTRRAALDDFDTLAAWRVTYENEILSAAPGAETEARARADIQSWIAEGRVWLALENGAPVSMSGFNARLPDTVQVGGVFTPREFRGRGFARAAVAGSLLDARMEGARDAVLFTEVVNHRAKRVYAALGFQRVGDYGMILLNAG